MGDRLTICASPKDTLAQTGALAQRAGCASAPVPPAPKGAEGCTSGDRRNEARSPSTGATKAERSDTANLHDRLDDLARRVARLIPSRHDPEAYHIEKSQITFELRQLARHAATR